MTLPSFIAPGRSADGSRHRRAARRQHLHLGADRHAVVEMDHVLVDHADAAGRDALADRMGLRRAVDAIERVLVVLPEIEPAGTDRIARAARNAHAALQLYELRQDVRPAGDHLGGRIPVGPFLPAVDRRRARPRKAFLAHAYPIADGAATRLDMVEITGGRIDD